MKIWASLAGLARTMVADLSGKIPSGTKRIRIVTNLKIYWDSIRIDQTPELHDIHVTEVPLANAELAYLGYPREIRRKPASDTVYSYSRLSPTGPYARAAGNYTRYGDVKSLLRASDDKFAIFSSGEGVKLDFDPRNLPALSAGWVATTSSTPMASRRISISTPRTPSPLNRFLSTACFHTLIPPVTNIRRTMTISATNWVDRHCSDRSRRICATTIHAPK